MLVLAAAVARTITPERQTRPRRTVRRRQQQRKPHSSYDTSSAAPALPLRAGERFVNLTMPEPYTPTAPQGGTDEYRCVIFDPHLTTPTFLAGSQFQPQNTPMVHHAIVLIHRRDNPNPPREGDF